MLWLREVSERKCTFTIYEVLTSVEIQVLVRMCQRRSEAEADIHNNFHL